MIRGLALTSLFSLVSFALSGCSFGGPVSSYPEYRPTPGQGQYTRPNYLNPQPPARVPRTDLCRSRLYAGLVGQHEGAIFFPGLPGWKRVIKPAETEGFGYGRDDALYVEPPLVEVTEFLPDRPIYASSISSLTDPLNLGPDFEDRLTIELDRDGYVQQVTCR